MFFALAPTAAQASTASIDNGTLSYQAAAGETNMVDLHTTSNSSGLFITIRDAGAIITPGNSCTSSDPHTANCLGMGVGGVEIDLGDLDDSLSTTGAPPNFGGYPIKGGPGNDRLTAAPTLEDRSLGLVNVGFNGGPGNDVLKAVDGDDLLRGGLGDDVIYGGAGNDKLSGSEGADALHGGVGADRVDGRGGDDALFVAGADLASGGLGDDSFRLPGPEPASLVCGDGRDSILGDLRAAPTRGGPWISTTCEGFQSFSSRHTRIPFPGAYPVSTSRAGLVTFQVPCAAGFRPCRGVLALSAPKHPFRPAGKARFRIRSSQDVSVRVTRGVARAARRRRVRLRARLFIPSQFGSLPVTWRFDLRIR